MADKNIKSLEEIKKIIADGSSTKEDMSELIEFCKGIIMKDDFLNYMSIDNTIVGRELTHQELLELDEIHRELKEEYPELPGGKYANSIRVTITKITPKVRRKLRLRGISIHDAQRFIDHSWVMLKQENDKRYFYLSPNGHSCVVIDIELNQNILATVYCPEDFYDGMRELMRRIADYVSSKM